MKRLVFVLSCGLLGVCAYSADSPPPNLHDLMKRVISVQTQVIWDTGNHATDDVGNIDPAKLTAADWARVAGAAEKVKRASRSLAGAAHVIAAAPGQKIQYEGNPRALGAVEVQQIIDAQPKVFSAFAQQLATSMDGVLAAVATHDAHKLGEVANDLDDVCESCHKVFWYPNETR